MSRNKKNNSLMEQMCRRLVLLTESYLQISRRELSAKLGYKNESTLQKAWKGNTFPDSEKLNILSKIQNDLGAKPNIHWLVTGEGKPLIQLESVEQTIGTFELRLDDIPISLANLLQSTVDEIIRLRGKDL